MKIYQEIIKDKNDKKIKLFGLTVYRKTFSDGFIKRKYLKGLLKTRVNDNCKKYYFLGIRFYRKQDKVQILQRQIMKRLDDIFYNMQVLSQVTTVHSYFSKFRRINEGKDVVLIACGPTIKEYKLIKDAVHIGVNGAVRLNNIDLDYLFLTDYFANTPALNDDIDKYKGNNCKKFYAVLPQRRDIQVRQNNTGLAGRILQKNLYKSNAYSFLLEDIFRNKWAIELTNEAFGDFGGSVFAALQFILYTNPQRVYLAGCDCTSGYFYDSKLDGNNYAKIKPFMLFKNFVEEAYPDIEIISINPVGLKGMFKDIYTNENKEDLCLIP